MGGKTLVKNTLVLGIIALFIVSAVSPMVIGFKSDAVNCDMVIAEIVEPESTVGSGLMDSPWPMESHDVRHTGYSPYSTADNPGNEIWRFRTGGWAQSSPAIGSDGTIYFGSDDFYAINPDGTLKWKKSTGIGIESCPAIDENGVIYIGDTVSSPDYMWAIYLNGTLKWRYKTGDSISSSPAIGTDGTIYFGCSDYNIIALYPNGTIRWKYITNHVVYSSPAIGNDGTIYCGSHDKHLYSLYPNGTLKWKFKTGDWIRGNPSVADDGTVYIGSFDGHLYAFYSNNGTMKWKSKMGWGTSGGCSIASDGTIYVGGDKLYAVYPDGTMKWSFDLGKDRWIGDSSPAISADGIIYVGANIGDGIGGELIAINPDGTERWRSGNICNEAVSSSPAIAEDGTIYICSASDDAVGGGGVTSAGYLHAFNTLDPNAPEAPIIDGPLEGRIEEKYEYTFTTTDPNGDDVCYYINWGDNHFDSRIGPYNSKEKVNVSHRWDWEGNFIIEVKAVDTNNLCSPFGKLEVTMPKNQQTSNMWFLWWLERFPILNQIVNLLMEKWT